MCLAHLALTPSAVTIAIFHPQSKGIYVIVDTVYVEFWSYPDHLW